MVALAKPIRRIETAKDVALDSYARVQELLASDKPNANALFQAVADAYGVLSPELGLMPEDVPTLFSDAQIANSIVDMQSTFAEAERTMEQIRGRAIAGKSNVSVEDLRLAPFYSGFYHLTEMEEALLAAHGHRVDQGEKQEGALKTAFIGISAIPLSPFLLHTKTVTEIDIIDYQGESVEIGQTIANKLGANLRINFINKKPQDHDYTDYHTVFVAARAKPKEGIVQKLTQYSNVQFMVMRVVDQRAKLFFQHLQPASVAKQGFALLHVSHPPPPFFQTALLFENMNFSEMSNRKSMYVPWAMTDEMYNHWYTPGSGGGGWHNLLYSADQTSEMLTSYVQTKGRSAYKLSAEGKVTVGPDSPARIKIR